MERDTNITHKLTVPEVNRGQKSYGIGKYRQIGSFPSYSLTFWTHVLVVVDEDVIIPTAHISIHSGRKEHFDDDGTTMKKEFVVHNMFLLIFSYPRPPAHSFSDLRHSFTRVCLSIRHARSHPQSPSTIFRVKGCPPKEYWMGLDVAYEGIEKTTRNLLPL